MKRASLHILILSFLAVILSSCHEIEEYDNDASGNFEQLWKLFDEHYCFFKEKDVDWDEVHDRYAPRAARCESSVQLFEVCSEMINELRDGHVNLSSSFNTSYYREWWSGYPENFDLRVIQEKYLFFNYRSLGGVIYAILPENIGYIRISSFESGLGDGNIDNILAYLILCDGIIIDVRNNGGGSMSYVEDIACRFVSERTLAGYLCHKDGPGHDDFSEPFAYYFTPPAGHLVWQKPVAVLCNRSTFSAANNFVSVMKYFPNVTVIGATTGGGSGMPLSYTLPNGWGVRMSASPVYDCRMQLSEHGVDPTPGFALDFSPEESAQGRDPILDLAISHLLD